MSDWKDRLGSFDDLAPDDGVYRRAQQGPRRELPEEGPSPAKRITAGLVAFAVFAAAAIFAWQAFRPTSGHSAAGDDDRGWPDLVLRVTESEGQVDASLSFGEISQRLPVGFEDEGVSPESPWFPTAVPVGTQLRIEESGDVDVSVEAGGRSMDSGGSDRSANVDEFPVDEFPQVQGEFSMIYVIDSGGRHGAAGSVIQLLDLDASKGSILTVQHENAEWSGPTGAWAYQDDAVMVGPLPNFGGDQLTVPAGSTIWLGGDADSLKLRISGEERWLETTPSSDGRQLAAVLPPDPGTHELEVTGRWGRESVDFSFQVQLQPIEADPDTPPEPGPTTTPVDDAQPQPPTIQPQETSDVLRVVCDADGIQVLTPVVMAQPDGLHVWPEITELNDPEVSLHSLEVPQTSYWSGSSGTDGEFVRDLPPGEATVHCESGPQQGDGPEEFRASFLVVSEGTFIDYVPTCDEVHNLPYADESSDAGMISVEEAVRSGVVGLQAGDIVEHAGYLQSESPWLVARVVRGEQVVAWFRVDGRDGWKYQLMDGYACTDSGLSIEGVDP